MGHLANFKKALKRTAAILCSAALILPSFDLISVDSAEMNTGISASQVTSEDIGLVGNLFCVSGSQKADHAALQWATTLPADTFTLYRSVDSENGFVPIYEGYNRPIWTGY